MNLKKISTIIMSVASVTAYSQIKSDSIVSKNLKETVRLSIYLPKDYNADPAKKFPVIYLLDSDINMPYFAPMTEFQRRAYREKGQGYILVGIDTKNRTMNYTPTKSSAADPNNKGKMLFTDSGGAEFFAKFLSEELKPKIEKSYHAENFSVLCGHSFGALFTLDLLAKHPDYFQAYIANDPSFWWDNSYLMKALQSRPKFSGTGTKPFVFVSLAKMKSHDHGFESGQPDSVPVVENYFKANGIPYKIVPYPDENHGSVSYKANFDALRELYNFRNTK